MLKLFGGGADHPMSNPKEARRVLDALPADDLKALEELAHWHESVSVADGFKPPERAMLVIAIDDAAQPRVRKVARDYGAAARPSRYQENRMWTQAHEYWKQTALAFGRSLDAAQPRPLEAKTLALVATRALRAAAQQIKWQHLRYGPVDPAVWGIVNKVYAFCETRGFAEGKLALYPSDGGETSPRHEFLKAVMFSASSPDSLLATEVDLVERVIAELASSFLLANAPAAGMLYWTDLARPMTPLRIVKPPEAAAGLRCFGPGNALTLLQGIMQRAEATRDLPPSLGATQDTEAAIDVLRYLAVIWSPEPPERKHARHAVKSRLAIAHGFAGVLEAVGGAAASLDFEQKATESWVVENVSAGGFGAVVPHAKGDWLRVGTLLAMQPDGGTNWLVGVIRRVSRTSPQEARVGIETLSRAPKVTKFRVRGLAEETGVLLPAAMLGSGEVSIALRAGVYPPGQNLEASIDKREHVYMPQGSPERAEDYELIRFREMIREA